MTTAESPMSKAAPAPRCAACGYDLSEHVQSTQAACVCPECGRAFDPQRLQRLPVLPGPGRLFWVAIRPSLAYVLVAALIGAAGALIGFRNEAATVMMICLAPTMLVGASVATVLATTVDHYTPPERKWAGLMTVSLAILISAAVGVGASVVAVAMWK